MFCLLLLQGMVPGPTIRVSAGESLDIAFKNSLADIDNTVAHNDYQSPNTTNLHTHGLHVAGTGSGDNSFLSILPGQSFNYSIKIPSDHMVIVV
jgi:FtsP/CotA-like multicopper oxidase with cupredoxin domain